MNALHKKLKKRGKQLKITEFLKVYAQEKLLRHLSEKTVIYYLTLLKSDAVAFRILS